MQWPILTIGNVNLNRHRRTFLKALAACPLCAALKVEAQESRHWTYEGDAGSEKWGELDSAYQACGTGTEQSPIDIKSYQMAAIEDLKFDWQPAAYPVANNGHTIQINVPSGSTLSLGTEQFAFRQFHFHSPSEHSLNGEQRRDTNRTMKNLIGSIDDFLDSCDKNSFELEDYKSHPAIKIPLSN